MKAKKEKKIFYTKENFFAVTRKEPHDCRIVEHAMSMSRSRNMSRNIS
jgi:hypothetical protein